MVILENKQDKQPEVQKDYSKLVESFDKNKEAFDAFMKGSNKDILNLFDQNQLDKKIADVVNKASKKGADKLDPTDQAYLVLKALRDGKSGDFQTLLAGELDVGKIELSKKYLELNQSIDKDKDLTANEKIVLKDQLKEEFATARNVAELEEHFGIAKGTVDTWKGVGDFIHTLLEAFKPATYQAVGTEFANICLKKGVDMKDIVVNIFDKARQESLATYGQLFDWVSTALSAGKQFTKESLLSVIRREAGTLTAFSNRCGERREATKDLFGGIARDLLQREIIVWTDFAKSCESLGQQAKATFESITTEYINAVNVGKVILNDRWNAMVDYCADKGEDMKIFLKTTTELALRNGTLVRQEVTTFCKNAGNKANELFQSTLQWCVEEGKATWTEIATFYENEWASVKDNMQKVTEFLIVTKKLARQEVSTFCTERGKEVVALKNEMQEFFVSTMVNLINQGTILRDDFIAGCKDTRESVKGSAIQITKTLYEAGKVTLEKAAQGLLTVVGSMVAVGKLLVEGFNYAGEQLSNLGKELTKLIYEEGQKIGKGVEMAYDFLTENAKTLYQNAKNASFATLDSILEVVGDLKVVFSTLVELGKITINKGLTWISMQYTSFVDMRDNLKDLALVSLDRFNTWLGAVYQNVKNKTLEFTQKISAFVQNLIDQGLYTVEKIAGFFIKAGESIAVFFNGLIEKGGALVTDVYNRFFKTYKTAEMAGQMLLQLGIGARNKVVDTLHDAGVAMETIAKLVLSYTTTAANALCDKLLGLLDNAQEAIGRVVDIVSAAAKAVANTVKERAYDKYSKIMSTADAAVKAYNDAKERLGQTVQSIGDWLHDKGVALEVSINLLKKNFGDQVDALKAVALKYADDLTESIASGFKSIGAWFSDAVQTN